MNRKRKIAFVLVLTVMLLAACTFAQAAGQAAAPDQSRIRTSAPDGLAYQAVFDASKHSLHLEISAAKSDLAALKAYGEDPENGWGGNSSIWGVKVGITPPANAASVQWWVFDNKMSDSMLHTALLSEQKEPAGQMVVEASWFFTGSYLNDGKNASLLPTRRTADEYHTLACRWLDEDGNEIGFEKLYLTADWDSMEEIPLGNAPVMAFPAADRVTWQITQGLVFAVQPSYDPDTGILSAVIDTAKTNWPLVISSCYDPDNKSVMPLTMQLSVPQGAAQKKEIHYGGGVQIGSVFKALSNQRTAAATSSHVPGEIGRYEESTQIFFPESASLYQSHGSLISWLDENGNPLQVNGSVMPCEAVRFDILFTDSEPFKMTLDKVPGANIVPDIQKLGVKTEVSAGSVKYFNENRTTGYQAYETAVLAPDIGEDTSDWQAFGRNNSMHLVVDPAVSGLKRRAVLLTHGVEDENIFSNSEVIVWKNAAGEVKAIQVLDVFISQGNPKLWPEYTDEINPFPAGQVSVSTINPVKGTSVTYDSARGVVKMVVDSEKLVAAAAEGANLFDVWAETTIRFTPPEGTVSYGVAMTGNGIIFGQDWVDNFGNIRLDEDQIYNLPIDAAEEHIQPFFRATTFELPDGQSAEYYYSINEEYSGNEYGGHVDIYYWLDAQGQILGRNYIVYQYDPVSLITTSKVLEDESELNDQTNGKKKPLIIADGKALGYGQGKLDLRAERSPSSEGTHHYELCLVNDENAEVKLKGKGTLYLPYPEGYDETNYTDLAITIAHYSADGSEIIESFSIAEGTIEPTKYGLRIDIHSLSPFVVSWEAAKPETPPTPVPSATPAPAPSATPVPAESLPKTGDTTPLAVLAALLVLSAGMLVLDSKRRNA